MPMVENQPSCDNIEYKFHFLDLDLSLMLYKFGVPSEQIQL